MSWWWVGGGDYYYATSLECVRHEMKLCLVSLVGYVFVLDRV